MQDDSDRDLIERVRAGDEQAFCILVRRYQARLRGFAARYLPDPNDVDDMIQDAFVDAYNHLDRFDTKHEFWPWLRTICRNRTFNYLRSRRVRRTVSLQVIDEALEIYGQDDLGADEETAERIAALRVCVAGLKESQQALIRQRYYRRDPVKSLAASLRQSAAGLSMRLYRIRNVLKRCVQQQLQTQP